jgi:hypothetical protein
LSRYLLAGCSTRSAEALPIIEDVAEKQAASAQLGPEHPNTVLSRFLLAMVLDTLGRSAEALPIVEDVAEKQAASAELGPEHRHTLWSQSLLAQILNHVGRPEEAEAKFAQVLSLQEVHPSLGPNHPDTRLTIERSNAMRHPKEIIIEASPRLP